MKIKNKKRITALAVLLLCCFTTACGTDDDISNPDVPENTANENSADDSEIASNADFSDIADTWYLDGYENAESRIEINADGEWKLYEDDGDGNYNMVDYGRLTQDPDAEEQYYAHSEVFDDCTYDMYMPLGQVSFWWGGENDTYMRLSDGN